ncbi:rhamnan synthesis F family protein [Phaeobacter sp. J2-8]|uniref:rhamnan synthesis F family protein n=1 Tax=Phaeobacter sp. J2-8 TaxID=2931394 RepID=UPI001FD41078|nr:rhamnan synthesis F family protein [Phaeobacter sp. J2-8]MCJ7874833.1 hypothetical protein [Phaeobacter sp. J2-8]
MHASDDARRIAESKLFNRDWYLERFPDVAICGLDPAEHFLRIGARLGRDPGPDFSTRAYLEAHPEIASQTLNPLLHHLDAEAKTEPETGSGTGTDYAVIAHAYHRDSFADLRRALACFPDGVDQYVSYPRNSQHHSEALIRDSFPGAIPMAVDNVGQDVGAFLQVLEQIDPSQYRFFCKLHSKGGNKLPMLWRDALLMGTVGDADRVTDFVRLFREDPEILLGGARELFLHGPSHLMDNRAALKELTGNNLPGETTGATSRESSGGAADEAAPIGQDWGFSPAPVSGCAAISPSG